MIKEKIESMRGKYIVMVSGMTRYILGYTVTYTGMYSMAISAESSQDHLSIILVHTGVSIYWYHTEVIAGSIPDPQIITSKIRLGFRFTPLNKQGSKDTSNHFRLLYLINPSVKNQDCGKHWQLHTGNCAYRKLVPTYIESCQDHI